MRREAEREEKEDAGSRFAQPVATNNAAFAFGGKKKDKGAVPPHPQTYTVQEGDTLYRISTRFYGSSAKWRTIRELNKATISTDGRLRAGQVIRLP